MMRRNTNPHEGIEITVIVSPDSSSNRWPGFPDTQNTFNVITLKDFSCLGIENNWVDAEEGHSCRSWLGFDSTREWSDHDRSGLGLPPSVDDGTLPLSDV